MAEEKVGIKIEVDGSQVTKSVGNVRKELKDANAELVRAQQEFGDYSQQAVEAAKKVAQLRDQISEAAETAKLFDPGAKFQAFSGAINAVAGGFAAVQGALGLVGVESEDLQKQLLKVQSALALSEGLSKITDSAKDFQRLSAVIQQTSVFQKGLAAANLVTAATQKVLGVATNVTSVGFKVLRGAIIGTGIGALAIGLIALVQNFDKVKKVVLNLIPGLGAVADFIGNLVTKVGDFIGITSEAERQTAKLLKDNAEAIRSTERELEVNGDKYDEYTTRKIEANLKYRKSFEELTKDESLTIAQRDKFIAEARARADRDIAKADADRQASIDKANKEAADKAAKAAKEAADKRKAAQKEQQQIQDEGQKELAQLINENEKAITETSIENENERAKKLIDIQLKQDTDRVNATKLSAELKAKIVAELEKKAQIERDKVQKKIDDEEKQRAEETAKRVAEIRTEIVENSITDETERRLFGIRAKYAAEIAEVEKGEGDVAALVAALKERQQQEEDAVEQERREKRAAERIAELEQITTNDQLDFEARTAAIEQLKTLNQQYLDDKLISQEEFNKNLKGLAKAEVDIEQKKFEAKIAQLDAYSQAITGLGNLIGQNTAVGKALAIAAATIDTYTATASQFRLASQNPITLVNPAYPYIVASTALLSGLARVRQIVAVKVPNSGGAGGGASAPAISGGGGVGAPPISGAAPLQPQRPSAQVFELGQQSIRGINTATQRAYVVESDITSSQERVSRLNRAARLG